MRGIDRCPNIVFLDLGWNSIEDLTPLKALPNLQRLYIDANAVEDISVLGALKKLTILNMSSNQVKDFSALEGLPLVHADLTHNSASFDLENFGDDVLAQKNGALVKRSLDEGNSIEFRAGNRVVRDSSSLKVAFADPNIGKKIAGLIGEQYTKDQLAQIKELNLRGLGISNLDGIEALEGLEYLDLGDNKIDDIEPLFFLSKLKVLQLDNNNIHDLRPIQKLDKLQVVSIDNNRLSNLVPLLMLKSLKKVGLSDNGLVIDFTPEQRDPLAATNAQVIQELENRKIFLATDFLAPYTRGNYVSQVATGVVAGGSGAASDAGGAAAATGDSDVGGNAGEGLAGKTGSPVWGKGDSPYFDAWRGQLIADPVLEKLVREELGIGGAPLRVEDLARLKKLNLYRRGVESLQGLQYATNLEMLEATGNSISDLSPLAGLVSLRSLFLDENMIERVDALGELSELNLLYLSRNRIASIEPLLGLIRLEVLGIGENGLLFDFREGIEPTPAGANSKAIRTFEERGVRIEGFNGSAYIEGNMIKFASADMITEGVSFADPALRHVIEVQLLLDPGAQITPEMMEAFKELDLSYLGIHSLKGLEFATELEVLNISGNKIIDLEPLRTLKKLHTLILDEQGRIEDFSPLGELKKKLELLSLKGVTGDYASVLTKLTNLKKLNIERADCASLAFLKPLTKLVEFNASNNELSNASSLELLSDMADLRVVNVAYNKIEDPRAFFSMPALRSLDLSSNPLGYDEQLSSATTQELILEKTGMVDLSWIGSFPELRKLDLEYNQIATLSPSLKLPKLEYLSIAYNGMSLDSEFNRAQLVEIIRHIASAPYKYEQGVSFLAGNSATTPIEMPYVVFEDAALEALVILASGASSRMELQPARLSLLRKLDASGMSISSLEGVQYLDGIEHLILRNNRIEDLSVLAPLKHLIFLDLGYNRVKDLSPLVGLINLRRLLVDENNLVIDFSADADPAVSDAQNAGAQVPGAQGAGAHTVASHGVAQEAGMLGSVQTKAQAGQQAKQNGMGLASILARGVEMLSDQGFDYRKGNLVIGDPSQVSRDAVVAPQDIAPDLSGSRVKKVVVKRIEAKKDEKKSKTYGVLAPIADPALREAVAQAMEAEGHRSPSALRSLTAYGMGIQSLEGIELLVGLNHLDLGQNEISSLRGLERLVSLESLSLDHNKIRDISALAALSRLRLLLLSSNEIQDLSPLAQAMQLQILGIADNGMEISFTREGRRIARSNGQILRSLWTRGTILRHNYENTFSLGNQIRGNLETRAK